MRNKLLHFALAAAIIAAMSLKAYAQPVLAAWNFSGNGGGTTVNAGTSSADVNNGTATLGPGLGSINYLSNSLAGTGQTASTLAAALAGNDYISFSITPAAGKVLTVSSISIRPVSQNQMRTFVLFSSKTGFTAGNELGSFTANGNMNLPLQTISIAGHGNIASAIEFRLYVYGATNQFEAVGLGNRQSGLSENDLVINGSSAGGSGSVDAAFTATPIAVDGILNEAGWTINNTVSRTVVGTPNNAAQFGVRWNNSYLFIGAVVSDANLSSDSPGLPWEDDALEIYIDGNNSKGPAYDAFDRQIVKSYNSGSIWSSAGSSTGILHATSSVTGGYTIEVAIPWTHFDVTPANNLKMGFDVGVNDDDNGGTRESQLMWNGSGNNWTNTSGFGTINLTGGATPSLTVSPGTLNFSAAGGTQTLSITSSISWTVSDDQPWITVSAANGSGNGSVSVVSAANNGASRSGTITIVGSGITRNVTIAQNGASTFENTNSGVGTNLSGVTAYSPEFAFVNLAKRSLRWTTNGFWPEAGNTIPNSSLDHAGYLKGGVNGWSAVLWDLPLAVSGDYVLRYDGTGTVTLSDNGFGGVEITSSAAGRVTATLTNCRFLLVHISSNSTTSPVTNIRVTRAGLENSSEVFDPDFITNWGKFNTLRFMDWMHTNASPIKFWQSSSGDFNSATAPKQGDYSYEFKGVPVEVMVALSNRLHANPWFCMPHESDDNYNTQFATYVRNNLTNDLKSFVEYSNETWNSGGYPFTVQYNYVNSLGQQAWPSLQPWEAGQKYHARRSGQIWTLWEQVYGNASSIIRVMGGFVGHANQFWTDMKLLTDNVYQKTDAVNINFYFGHDIGSSANPVASADQVFQKIPATKTGLYYDMDNLRTLLSNDSRYQHIKIVAYEGGQHLAQSQDGGPHQILIDANRDSRMGAEYTEMLNSWKAKGGTLFCNFSSTSVPSRYGSWGVLERQTGNAPNQRIKYDAIANWIAANPKWWTIKGGVASTSSVGNTITMGETPLAVTLHPNPSKDKLNVSLENDYGGPVHVSIVNANGKPLMAAEWIKLTDRVLKIGLDVSRLPAGVYFIKVNAGVVYVERFLKE